MGLTGEAVEGVRHEPRAGGTGYDVAGCRGCRSRLGDQRGARMSTIWVDLLGAQVRYYGDELRTRVIEAGEGEALVLIHGVGGHAEAYSRNVVRLGQHHRAMAI